MTENRNDNTRLWRGRARAAGLVGGGLLLGGVLTGTIAANAATSTPSTTGSPAVSQGYDSSADQSQPQRSDETLLTGTTATKVTAAVLAAYPDATIQRVETDSDGVYEAHLVTAAGEELQVGVDASFAVTGTNTGHGGSHGNDNDADDAPGATG